MFIFRTSQFKWIYFFFSHQQTQFQLPITSAELRFKRQTELETWGMVPNAGPDTIDMNTLYDVQTSQIRFCRSLGLMMAAFKDRGQSVFGMSLWVRVKNCRDRIALRFYPIPMHCNMQCTIHWCTLHCKDTVCNNLTRFAMSRGAGKWWKPQCRQSTTISSKCTHRAWCPLWIWS